jgi:multiple sugar transport system substrate-binding protein
MPRSRRDVLVGLGALGAAPLAARLARAAPPDRLNVLAHRVHKTVATAETGGDVTAKWRQESGLGVEWITFDIGPLKERLFREASLKETTIDVGFLLNTQASPSIVNLFEPLDAYQAAQPIEDFADIFRGMADAMTFDGKLYGVPFRHATSGLHYNAAFLAERGVAGPPRTIEELVETAKRLTYARSDGAQVVGLVMPGVTYPNVVDLARAWDGEFITADYRVVANEKPMVRAITVLRELFQAGAFPKSFAALSTEDVNTWMQTGRAAMAITSMGRHSIYNDPAKSKFAGQIQTTTIPVSAELAGRYPVAPAKVETWSMVVPKAARDKKLSWSFLRALSSKEATLMAALNGNGPVRSSTYDEPRFARTLPYAEEERRVLKVARAPMPAFDNAQKAADYFKEEAEAAVLGMKPPQKAMDDLVARVRPLVKP